MDRTTGSYMVILAGPQKTATFRLLSGSESNTVELLAEKGAGTTQIAWPLGQPPTLSLSGGTPGAHKIIVTVG